MSDYHSAAIERKADEFRARLADQVRSCYSKRISSASSDPCRFNIALLPTEAQERAGRLRPVGFDPTQDSDKRAMELAIRQISEEVEVDFTRSPYGAPKSFKVSSFDTIRWAYDAIGEDPPMKRDKGVIVRILKDAAKRCRMDWCADYLSKSSTVDLCKDVDDARNLARLISAYSRVEKPVWLRTLSILAFSDSKEIERHGWDMRLLKAAECQGVISEGVSKDRALNGLGILHNPTPRLIGGSATLVLQNGSIDLKSFGMGGFYINGELSRNVRGILGGEVLLEVENLACFYDLCRDPVPGALVVYGGGFSANATDTSSFAEVVEMFERFAVADSRWLAWSDIDHGGFEITRNIIKRFPRFRPFLMDVRTIESVDKSLLLSRADDYIESYLKPDLFNEELQDFHAVCSYCIDVKATLEQEALLLGRVQKELRSLIS